MLKVLFQIIFFTVVTWTFWPLIRGFLEILASWRKDALAGLILGAFAFIEISRCISFFR